MFLARELQADKCHKGVKYCEALDVTKNTPVLSSA